ncbi:FP1 [Symbiodinium sp. CCMP2592]|nr:FP1 [Symbiodinium sp. CCMP2592]
MDTLTAVIAFSEGIVLTSLMFFFCLYAMLPNPHDKRTFSPAPKPQSRAQVWAQGLKFKFITGVVCQRFRGFTIICKSVEGVGSDVNPSRLSLYV